MVAVIPLTLVALGLLKILHSQYHAKLKTRKRGSRYIYFFRGRGEFPLLVKIGRSNDYIKRLKQHKTANPFGVHIYGVVRVVNDRVAEKYIHRKFSYCRVNTNNEWFWLTPFLWLYIFLIRDTHLTERAKHEV